MAQFTIYRSSDTGAPTLSGTVNSLVNLLQKCLVDGYGSKTAAGWTMPYTGTNKAVFKNGGGCQMYFRIDDNASGTGGVKEAKLNPMEVMTDVDTGTGWYSNLGTYHVIRKSTSADSTARSWIILADARTAYIHIATGDSGVVYTSFAMGEFYSLVNNDNYRNFVSARTTENSGSVSNDSLPLTSVIGSTVTGMTLARPYTGTGGVITPGKHGDSAKNDGNVNLMGTVPYPNPSDGGLYLSPIWITETSSPAGNIRGRMRGMWHFLHGSSAAVADGDVFTGTGSLGGKTFIAIKTGNSTTTYIFETSDTLETN